MSNVYVVQYEGEPLNAFSTKNNAINYLISIGAIQQEEENGDVFFQKGDEIYYVYRVNFNPLILNASRRSPYVAYMKQELARIKSEHPTMDHRTAFRLAVQHWQQTRGDNNR